MPKFYFRKLVRNKVLENCLEEPETLETDYRVLDDREFVSELIRKVAEEATEIPLDSKAELKDVLSELADLQAVIDALRERFNFSEKQLREAVDKKVAKKGDFSGRYYIESVLLADNSPWIEYFRSDPDRFPEE